MEAAVLAPLVAWENFYVIIGSSAAALTGLQFVVIALSAEAPVRDPELGAFATPTIVHFCAVLVIAAIVSAPWHTIASVALTLSLCGAAGIAYTVVVGLRAWRQTRYAPVLEDWLFHCAFPLVAYTALLSAAFLLDQNPPRCLFAIAATALSLLFIGIHNAWDAATYIAMQRGPGGREPPAGG